MRKMIVYSAFFIPLLLSCVSKKGIPFADILEYASMEGYKNLYIVDTIQIEAPVIFFTKSGYRFVMSKKYFDSYSGSEKTLFKTNNAFLVGDFPIGLPLSFYKNSGKEIDCSVEKFRIKKKGIQETCYKINPDYFILMLVNGDYYNQAFCGIDGPPAVKDKRKTFNYYKVVMPVCIRKPIVLLKNR
jgi:hypothetical protein